MLYFKRGVDMDKEKRKILNTMLKFFEEKGYKKEEIEEIEELAEDEVVKARIRYHQAEKEATAKKNPDGTVAIHFLEPQRAITKGQAVVLYRDNHVVGGGTIIK